MSNNKTQKDKVETIKLPWGDEYKLVPISKKTKNRSDDCNWLHKQITESILSLCFVTSSIEDKELKNLISGIIDKLQNRLRISKNKIERFMDETLIENDKEFLTLEKLEEGYWSPFVGRKSNLIKKLKEEMNL
jgi:hypothetical protein